MTDGRLPNRMVTDCPTLRQIGRVGDAGGAATVVSGFLPESKSVYDRPIS